ncbi:MAG TPA: hypothetical protein VLX92_35420, partial [Kofleriaceae bacterium]|nr:hypothetical protein [Kofleriaceae bacterium]
GSIDPGVIATHVAAELARPVALATGDCRAPCLAIAVADGEATVTFTGEAGRALRRTISLGDDPAQWPVVVTLLAGNLVRDEAADVLALVPPPAPPPIVAAPPPIVVAPPPVVVIAPPVAVPLRDDRARSFVVGLVPGLSTDLGDLDRTHDLSLGVIASVSGGVRGIAVSGAVDVVRGEVAGAQVAGAVAVAGELTGVQVAGAAAVAGQGAGTQIAGAVALAHGDADVQIGGAVALAEQDTDLQIAGAVAVTRRTAAVQIAGAVDVADHVTGVQIAPINIAHSVDGVQIGVINVGGAGAGDSFGLINIVHGGRTDLEAAVDERSAGTLLLRHGSRHWHNVYGIGAQPISVASGAANNDVWMYGLGLGPSFHLGPLPTDLEAMAWHVNHGDRFDDRLSLLTQLRLTVALPIGPVKLVAGGAINAYISNDPSSPFAPRTIAPEPMTTDVTVHVWPSVFAGVRI